MDFDALQDILAREVLGDRSEDVWSIANDQLPMLYNASVEIASVLGFPQSVDTGTLTAGDETIAAPTGMLSSQINQLIIGGYNAKAVSYVEVLAERARRGASGAPTKYNYDPRRGTAIQIGPAASGAWDYYLEYTEELDTSAYSGSTDPWDGLFPQFHWLIPVRAGVNAWRSVQDFERARFFLDEYSLGVAAFAAFLGVPNPMGDPDQQERFRLDTGARS